jgi:Ca-activated chloride channel family protein
MYLLGLILLPLMGAFFWWLERKRRRDLALLGNRSLIERLSGSVNWGGRRWRTGLVLVVLASLILALARPQWGTITEVVEQEGIEVMVALDVSESMLAQDVKPDRLSRAKMEIADLMNRLGGDEIGLVLFSGASFIQFPLTADYATARTFLDSAYPQVISRPGTAIGDAIRTAMSGFDMNRSSQKVILLITDGENHEGDALSQARDAASRGILLYTIGFGSPHGEPVPEYGASGEVIGYKKDQQGEIVLSRLDEAMLQEIAAIGGGQYYRSSASGSELDALISELNALQEASLTSSLETRGIERFQALLVIGSLALVAAEMIPDRVRAGRVRPRNGRSPAPSSRQSGG